MTQPTPIAPAPPDRRDEVRALIASARFAALAVLHPETGWPYVSRIGLSVTPEGAPMALISHLALHTKALVKDPRCGLLVGEPGPKGDPLTHPRAMLTCRAELLPRNSPEFLALREIWAERHPKSRIYLDLPDFIISRFVICEGVLNAGFGKAFAF